MSTTYIAAFSDSDAADTEAGHRKGLGYKVIGITKTNRIQVDGETPPSIIWDSGEEKDWYIVIATKDEIKSDPA